MDTIVSGLGVLLDHGLVFFLLLLVAGLFLLILDEDRAALWRGRIFRAVLALSGRRDHEKNYIANDLKGRLNLARRKLHHHGSNLPVAVDVQWIDVESPQSYEIREGEYVVKLNPATEQRVNIVRLAEAMVQRTTLLGIRHVTGPGLQQAIDIAMIRKLLSEIDTKASLDYFHSNVYTPLRTHDDDFRRWDNQIVEIDEQGLYERLLLVELDEFGRRIAALAPRPYMIGEVESLVAFLSRLATRREGEKIPLDYVKAHIRVSVVLVAKTGKLLSEGIGPYLEAVRMRARKVDVIYVITFNTARLSQGLFWDQFRRLSAQLAREICALPGVAHDFTVPYRYLNFRGEPSTGLIARYTVATEPIAA